MQQQLGHVGVCGSFVTLGAYLTSHLESNRYRLQVRLLQRAPERLTGLASLQTHTNAHTYSHTTRDASSFQHEHGCEAFLVFSIQAESKAV